MYPNLKKYNAVIDSLIFSASNSRNKKMQFTELTATLKRIHTFAVTVYNVIIGYVPERSFTVFILAFLFVFKIKQVYTYTLNRQG